MTRRLSKFLFALIMIFGLGDFARAQDSTDEGWLTNYAEAFDLAKSSRRPLLVDFFATWCHPCRMLDEEVFPDPEVARRLGKFVCVKVDIDQDRATAFAWRISSIPRTVILNIHGQTIADRIGFMEVEDYAALLDEALAIAEEKLPEEPAPDPDDVDRIMKDAPAGAPPGNPGPTAADLRGPRLIRLLGHADPRVRTEAAERVARYPAQALPILLGALQDGYLGTRIAARQILIKLGAPVEPFDPWASRSERESVIREIISKAQP